MQFLGVLHVLRSVRCSNKFYDMQYAPKWSWKGKFCIISGITVLIYLIIFLRVCLKK